MKTGNLKSSLLAIAAATTLAFMAVNVVAQDATAAQPAVASQAAPQLSYGVPQVLQLVQAKVSEGVIVNFIQNSGTVYGLGAGEIVYLKQLGVSDNVLNAMLNQRSRVTGAADSAATTASSPPASAPAASDQTYAAAPAAPAVTYVPEAAQSSTVYVIPDAQTYYYSSPYVYPYYGGYYGWPAVSLSFGWGGYHGGYYGGWHGGGYRGGGGGWHGGGGGHR
jgi:hypothetical protein